jgi:hypothetical protein
LDGGGGGCIVAAEAANTKQPPAKEWMSEDGFTYTLNEAFDAVFTVDLELDDDEIEADPATVTVSLGGRVKCGKSYNPTTVAACYTPISSDGMQTKVPHPIAIKSSGVIRVADAEHPEVGVRVVYQSIDESNEGMTITIDFVCDAGLQRAKDVWIAVAAQTPDGYFVSVRTAYGCPNRPAFKPHTQATPDPNPFRANLKAGIVEWSGKDGAGWRYDLQHLAKDTIELHVPNRVGQFKFSFGSAVACGAFTNPTNVLACLYPDGKEPIVLGLKESMTIWRTSESGMSLKFTGGNCEGSETDKATWINLICDKSNQAKIMESKSKWHAQLVNSEQRHECLFVVEIRSSFACGTASGKIVTSGKSPNVITKSDIVASSATNQNQNKDTVALEPIVASSQQKLMQDQALAAAANQNQNKDTVAPEKDVASPTEQPTLTPVGQGCIEGDCENGFGVWVWPSGSEFRGDWVNGKRTGFGEQDWPDGRTKYIGNWLLGNRHGKGAHAYARGDSYQGDWFEDRKAGRGEYVWKDGTVYVGDFVMDQAHGKGRKRWTNEKWYDGAWDAGRPHGRGIAFEPPGSTWDGEWTFGHRTDNTVLTCNFSKGIAKHNSECVSECPLGTHMFVDMKKKHSRFCVPCAAGCKKCKARGEVRGGKCLKCKAGQTMDKYMCHPPRHDDL